MGTEQTLPQTSERLAFPDLLRGWAIVLMIETHVFNAMIQMSVQQTLWYGVLDFVNGLVAPSFLFVSGFVFIVSTFRKSAELRKIGRHFWKQLGRMLAILAVAYSLHLPTFSFNQMTTATTEVGWLKFFQADILHCIVIGWLFLLGSFLVIRSEDTYRRWLIGSAVGFVLMAPFIWDIDLLSSVPAPIAAYLNGIHYSLFPIFPWLGFMTAGSVVALIYQSYAQEGRQLELRNRLVWIGAIGLAAFFLLLQISFDLPFVSSNLRANPVFFVLRLSIVLLFLAATWRYTEKRGSEKSFFYDASRESFLIYVGHLLVIYGDFWNGKSIARIVAHSWSPMECALGTIAVILWMILLAKGWSWLKKRSQTLARATIWGFAVVVTTIYFVR